MSNFTLGGLISAPHTPFTSNGEVNLPVIEKQAASLIADGVKGVFICGTTGEGLSLTTDERMAVARRWTEVAGRDLKIVVHVGHNSQPDAVALAAHARQVRAAAIGALPPFFFKPGGVAQVVEFMTPVAAAGGDLPFYYYHIPSMTGVTLCMADLLEAAAGPIPTLRGIKFTHGDLMDYQRCQKALGGRFEIAWGVDEMLLWALAVGAQSAVGSTYNYSAPLYAKMIEAYRRGDMATAQECSQHAVDSIAILLKHGGVRTGKAIMGMIGIDCGPTRSPIPPMGKEEAATVRRAYEQIGFFDWARKRA